MDGPTYTQGNEGCRLTAYQDTLGIWTIGYGHTGPEVCEGLVWTQDQADAAFLQNYDFATNQATNVLGVLAWTQLDPIRRAALTDMTYQLGGNGVSKFAHMLSGLRQRDWQTAHDQCLASIYAQQTPNRAKNNAQIYLTGDWPLV